MSDTAEDQDLSSLNLYVWVEVGSPDYNDGEVDAHTMHEVAEDVRDLIHEGGGVPVLPWYVTIKALPVEAEPDETPVVPYTVTEDELKEILS